MIADRWKGHLGKIQLFKIGETGLVHFYPIIHVRNVKLQRTFGHAKSKAAKSLIIQTDTKISFKAQKLADALSHFLNIPTQSIEEQLPPKMQTTMHISLNAAHHIQITFFQTTQKIEIGPRIIVSHLIWKP